MNKRYILISVIILILGCSLYAEIDLRIGGINEATYIYRTAEDSLNSYFSDSFAFNLNYRNFGFGMKFIADLPKYSTSQSELLEDINAQNLQLGWKEIYANYQKDAFKIHAGTINETFGSGLVFRSWEDEEFDQDNRIGGFFFAYDSDLKVKALYGAIANSSDSEKYDLAYGADIQYPILGFLRWAGTAFTFRSFNFINPLTQEEIYDQRDIFSSRINFNLWDLELNAEYAISELYVPRQGNSTDGSAIYVTGNYFIHPIQLGAAYKKYDQFNYLLHDIPLANHHNETLADNQISGYDEEGVQGWINWEITDQISLKTDYAEAWNSAKTKKMNDAFGALDWWMGESLIGLEYSQIEKIDDAISEWQMEQIPALSAGFSLFGKTVAIKTEYKKLSKRIYATEKSHYEPKIQSDLSLGKLSLSLGVQSQWEELSEMMEAKYSANLEAKYPIFDHTDFTLFVGKDAGGKVCRNGICRYVAPFQGLKAELSTRF